MCRHSFNITVFIITIAVCICCLCQHCWMRNSLNDRKINLSAFEYIKNCKQSLPNSCLALELLLPFFDFFSFSLFIHSTLPLICWICKTFTKLNDFKYVKYFLWNYGINECFKFSTFAWVKCNQIIGFDCFFCVVQSSDLFELHLLVVFFLS